MSLVEINWKPTDRQLRQFGGIALVLLPALGWYRWYWSGGSADVAVGSGIAGLVIFALSWRAPRVIAPLFVGLTIVTIPIGLVVGEVALLCLYWLLFVPTGLVFRLMGRDALERRIDRSASSYWQHKRQPRGVGSYFRQS